MDTLTVELADRAYPIHIGSGLMTTAHIAPHIQGRQVLVVTNETVAPLYLSRVLEAVTDFEAATVVLPDGEAHKHLDTLDVIFSKALENRFSRNATVIALGGGVVGDMAGFAAASYQRGINFIQIPTTLLAQVDSSVGGKTGVNHRLGKNMIGAFHQPVAVLADTDTLKTLPGRELSAGLAEVIKYGLLGDLHFLEWIESHMDGLRSQDAGALTEAIRRACAMKADIVRRDEREGGVRALLNLGHTFGHAIEAHLGYGDWLHGEAVGAGMVMAAQVSAQLGALDDADVARVISVCAGAGLPTQPPTGMTPQDFMTHMAVDKKNVDGRMRFVLMRALGDAYVEHAVNPESLSAVLTTCCH
jgi:3-dehydroquinate synthase